VNRTVNYSFCILNVLNAIAIKCIYRIQNKRITFSYTTNCNSYVRSNCMLNDFDHMLSLFFLTIVCCLVKYIRFVVDKKFFSRKVLQIMTLTMNKSSPVYSESLSKKLAQYFDHLYGLVLRTCFARIRRNQHLVYSNNITLSLFNKVLAN